MPALNWDKTYQRRLVAPRKVLVMHVLQEYMSHLCMYEPSIVHMIVNLAFEGVQGGITALSPLMNCMFSETEHADRVHPLAYPIWGLGPRLTETSHLMLTSHAPRPTVVADFESAIEAHTHIGEVMKAVIMGFDPNQSGCQNKDYRVSLQILHDLALKCMDRQASSERWHRRIRNRFKADARKELDELVDYMG